jgi:hypothetical protein
MINMPSVALPLLLAALLQSAPYTAVIMPPADDAARDPGFTDFRRYLLDAIERVDMKAIWAVTSSDVLATLGGKKGVPALRRVWGIDRSPKAFLSELRTVLRLGGRLSGCEFVAPYVYSDYSNDLSLISSYAAVLEQNAPIHSKPSTDSPIIARSRYELLRYDVAVNGPWVRVRIPGGGEGYMEKHLVRSPSDTHAIFMRILGEWRMVDFSAGGDY